MDIRAGQRVLDVATGTGTLALRAAAVGAHVVGLDFTPELLDTARARAAAAGVHVRRLFHGSRVVLDFDRGHNRWRSPSPEAWVAFMETADGPTVKAREPLAAEGRWGSAALSCWPRPGAATR